MTEISITFTHVCRLDIIEKKFPNVPGAKFHQVSLLLCLFLFQSHLKFSEEEIVLDKTF